MSDLTLEALLKAGAHFGHQTKRWNPKMKPYILTQRSGIHLINLKETLDNINRADEIIIQNVLNKQPILFVGTKKQARVVVKEQAEQCGVFYVTERWLGGMLTNFGTIRRSVETLENIELMEEDGTMASLTKKEAGKLRKKKEKLANVLGGVRDMKRLPGVVIIVDTKKEHIVVSEARKLKIPIIAIVDTNCDPDEVDCPIPANDDAIKSIEIIIMSLANTIKQANEKEKIKQEEEKNKKREQEEKNDAEIKVKKVVKKKEVEKVSGTEVKGTPETKERPKKKVVKKRVIKKEDAQEEKK
ncbi:MAG: 30S ribosomal protein S2 [bacterium]